MVAVGEDRYGQCRVEDWRGIVAVAAGNGHTGNSHTVGLRPDGTVVAGGWNKHGQCDVAEWRDVVAIAAGCAHTLGLRSDGTVVAAGDGRFGQCDVGGWRGVRLPWRAPTVGSDTPA